MPDTLRRFSRPASLVLLALLAAGCNRQEGNASTLVVQQSADYPTLDPAMSYDTGSGQFVENVYETLLTYKGNSLSDLEGVLATEWNTSNGDRTYTFTLRPDVKFQSGNPFRCEDAEYTFRRDLVVNNADSWTWFLSESLLGTASNANDDKSVTWDRITQAVSCNDQDQLVFNLPKVDPAFLAKLAYAGAGIVDKAHAVKIGEWDGTEATWKEWVGKDLNNSALSQQPSGTGAYRLAKRDANSTLLQAFDDYWGGKPAIGSVIVQRVEEEATRLEALKRGDADLIETGPRPVLQQLKGTNGVTVIDDLPNTTVGVIAMNQKISDKDALGSGRLDGRGIPADFFSDPDVRRAFTLAFDYETYIRDVQQGKGRVLSMALPASFPGYAEDVPTARFDIEEAEEAFRRAWGGQVWKNGFELTAHYRAGSQAQQTAMELLKKNVEALNPKFKLNIQAKQWSEMLQDSQNGGESMIALAWAPDYADPDNFVSVFYASTGYYNTRLNYRDPQVDQDVSAARATTDVEERNRLYRDVAERAEQNPPFILQPAGVNFIVVRDNLKGATAETYNPLRSFYTGTFWRELSKD